MLVVQLCLVSMGDSLFDNASVATLVAGIIASALFMANISYGALCIAILRQMGQANYWQAAALGSFASLIWRCVGGVDSAYSECARASTKCASLALLLSTSVGSKHTKTHANSDY